MYSAVDPSVASWSPEEVFEEVSNVAQSLKARQTLFTVSAEWTTRAEKWRTAAITSLGMAEIQREVNGFIHQIDYLEKGMNSMSSKTALNCYHVLCIKN